MTTERYVPNKVGEETPKPVEKFMVKANAFNGLMVREKPKPDAEIVGSLRFETIVSVETVKDGFGKIADPEGWIDLTLARRM